MSHAQCPQNQPHKSNHPNPLDLHPYSPKPIAEGCPKPTFNIRTPIEANVAEVVKSTDGKTLTLSKQKYVILEI